MKESYIQGLANHRRGSGGEGALTARVTSTQTLPKKSDMLSAN